MSKDFEAYAVGIISASVCTSLPLEEAMKRLNEQEPLDGGLRWEKSTDKTFKSGQPNPCPCEQNPKTHKHYLFNC